MSSRDLSSSTIFYRELDVVEPMTVSEERTLVMKQENNHLRMLKAILSIERGSELFFGVLRRYMSGDAPEIALIDASYWKLRDGVLPENRRDKMEVLLKDLRERIIIQTVNKLHLLWQGVEMLGEELFRDMARCRALLRERAELLSECEGGSLSLRDCMLDYVSADQPERHEYREAWRLYTRIAGIRNELDVIEVRTGCDVHSFSLAEKRYREAQERNCGIRIRFVEANLGLVISMVRKYFPCGIMDEMDLVQEGCRGLMEAVRLFDYQRGLKLSTYAVWWIRQTVMKAILRHSRVVRLPAHIHDADSGLREAMDDFALEYGRMPNLDELANFMGKPRDQVEELYLRTAPALSLDHTGSDHDTTIADYLESKLQPPDHQALDSDTHMRIKEALSTLTDREKTLITLRFGLLDGEPCTLQQIGRVFGITRERVRQLEEQALEKLRGHGLITDLICREDA
ncbi:MAG: sigma-70 family RNA polymerase sigma factor [Candidatus Aegiribacteria sp.]|nr:sigma-70 family RNA polymerase sigma factor [Candidatus Aegiribacteria sp.]